MIQPVKQYRRNTSSLETLCHRLRELGCRVKILSIPVFLMNKFGDCITHTPNGLTLLVTK